MELAVRSEAAGGYAKCKWTRSVDDPQTTILVWGLWKWLQPSTCGSYSVNHSVSAQLRLTSPTDLIPSGTLGRVTLIVSWRSSTFHLHMRLPWWFSLKTARRKKKRISQKYLPARFLNAHFKSHRLQAKMEAPFLNKETVMRKYSLPLLLCKVSSDRVCPVAPPHAPLGYCLNLWKWNRAASVLAAPRTQPDKHHAQPLCFSSSALCALLVRWALCGLLS